MNDFFSIIGTIASIGSIPLSVYLFIKSKENNIDKVKREIVRILSHQIGDRRQLTTFEIQTVINSKCRDYKIDSSKVSVNEVIEDLVAETISNPLLDKTIKETILKELKAVYFKGELLLTIDSLEAETRPESEKHLNEKELEISIKKIIDRRKEVSRDIERIRNRRTALLSNYFGLIATIMTLLVAILSVLGKQKYETFNKTVSDFFEKNDFYLGLVISGITALLTGLVTFVTWKIKRQREKK